MTPVLKMILLGVGLAALVVVAVGILIPADYSVTRTAVVDAEPSAVHPLLEDLGRWGEWSPWTAADPGITVTYGSTRRGAGASMTWTSGPAGGQLTLTDSDPSGGVGYRMAFKGGKFPTEGTIALAAIPGGTEVTWTVTGNVGFNPFNRFMRLMLTSRLGSMFEDGLDRLAAAAEMRPDTPPAVESAGGE